MHWVDGRRRLQWRLAFLQDAVQRDVARLVLLLLLGQGLGLVRPFLWRRLSLRRLGAQQRGLAWQGSTAWVEVSHGVVAAGDSGGRMPLACLPLCRALPGWWRALRHDGRHGRRRGVHRLDRGRTCDPLRVRGGHPRDGRPAVLGGLGDGRAEERLDRRVVGRAPFVDAAVLAAGLRPRRRRLEEAVAYAHRRDLRQVAGVRGHRVLLRGRGRRHEAECLQKGGGGLGGGDLHPLRRGSGAAIATGVARGEQRGGAGTLLRHAHRLPGEQRLRDYQPRLV
mmetsp:Transcript_91094/g.262657  ORF Transcript_91094/g.262657 Transcript_91094/m.262657 type:complete len:280 (-) Transcript_91094:551-1390(-)